jgi:hypothetical protein
MVVRRNLCNMSIFWISRTGCRAKEPIHAEPPTRRARNCVPPSIDSPPSFPKPRPKRTAHDLHVISKNIRWRMPLLPQKFHEFGPVPMQ